MTGWPVQPVPDHTFASRPTGEEPDIGLSGYRHNRSGGEVGTGPVPKNVRVGLPRNMVRPLTDPHGSYTESAVTTPVGRSNGAVVVEVPSVPALLVGGAAVVVVGDGAGDVVVVASGSAETTLSTPATHADASRPKETRSIAMLRIGASVEGDSRCSVTVALRG